MARATSAAPRTESVAKAQKAAESAGPAFFSGEDALREVAKCDGVWNWALVGPDPAKLPLSGGGIGGVDEMREAIGNHAHSFGLLRMTFGVGSKGKTKFVFVHASDAADSGNFSHIEHGHGFMAKPQMCKAITNFTAIAAEVHFQCAEECTVKHVVDKLRDVVRGVDTELITVENFEAAVEHHKEQHPEVRALEQEQEQQRTLVRSLRAPRASVCLPDVTMGPAGDVVRLRQRVKRYAKGDTVEFWSGTLEDWVLDAEVEEVAAESRHENGCRIVAGSLKIAFANGTHAEWIVPSQVGTDVRPSLRPKVPAPRAGYLRKETHEWIAQRHKRYFELSKGFLRWWNSEVDAKHGRPASNTVYLLGLQQQREGLDLKLRTTASMGALYSFEAATEEEAEAWSQALWAHAGYTNELREFSQTQRDNNSVRGQQELLRFAVAKENSVATEVTEATEKSSLTELRSSGTELMGGA